ncbi:MAG: cobalamin-independent methionine synthase II family protein [Alphaproteobacteria bacterium]|jgi:5-methyltetrahydropteroyltriglutamate--homocysteine methyltransferase|nr:cobalamin-independent methionine synthase II family protein [Alphaproteobacteria bacterium]
MFLATKDKPLATSITGSLPRPEWFTSGLEGRAFSLAMGDRIFREQYNDAVAISINDQWRAGLDVVTDGDMRFDIDVGGRAWHGYVHDRMGGMSPAHRSAADLGPRRRESTPGDILHEVGETRLPPILIGPATRGDLEYADIWRVAQRVTDKPVKLGSCCGQLTELLLDHEYYTDRVEAMTALSVAMNEEYHELADAGCPVIQLEEPCLHFNTEGELGITLEQYVEAFNVETAGLRDKTEIWAHTCWGNPFAQKIESGYLYKPILSYMDQLDADVLTFETATNGGEELAEIGAAIGKDKKICLGVIDHRTLQVERPDEVAELIRKALKHIEPERLVISSDCGFGRQGMSRVHAFYKMVALVWGTNIVRKELGLDEAPIPATEERFSLI